MLGSILTNEVGQLKKKHFIKTEKSSIYVQDVTSAAVSTPVGPPPTTTKCKRRFFISSDISGRAARSRLSNTFL